MTLIDADKLIEICRKGWKLFGREDEKLKHWVDEDDIRNQPEVKAIPIEWIEKWMAYWAKILPDWGAFEVCAAMLKDWEKENV